MLIRNIRFWSTFKRPIYWSEGSDRRHIVSNNQKAGILNAIQTLSSAKVAEAISEVIATTAVDEITVDLLTEKVEGISQTAAQNVAAAMELHLAIAKAPKARAKRPTTVEKFVERTSEEDRDSIAVTVATLRINAEGTKPTAWRKIRETLGLKNEEFHKVIRLSDTWTLAVCARISDLRQQEGGWSYNGKLEVLTGIDGFNMSLVDRFDEAIQDKETQS